jgi:hypothetical protein
MQLLCREQPVLCALSSSVSLTVFLGLFSRGAFGSAALAAFAAAAAVVAAMTAAGVGGALGDNPDA